MSNRKEVLLRALKESQTSYEVQNVVELMNLLVDERKEELTTCGPEKLGYLQGEIKGYRALSRFLSRPDITPKE